MAGLWAETTTTCSAGTNPDEFIDLDGPMTLRQAVNIVAKQLCIGKNQIHQWVYEYYVNEDIKESIRSNSKIRTIESMSTCTPSYQLEIL